MHTFWRVVLTLLCAGCGAFDAFASVREFHKHEVFAAVIAVLCAGLCFALATGFALCGDEPEGS